MTSEKTLTESEEYDLEELEAFKDIEYDQRMLFWELIDHGNTFPEHQQAALIIVTLRRIYEQSHSTKIENVEEYRRFEYWAYWTYGVEVRPNRDSHNGTPSAYVNVLPREVFNAIRYGGLTDEQIKKEFPEFLKNSLLPQEAMKFFITRNNKVLSE